MGVLPVNPAGPGPERLPPRPPIDTLREKLREEYDSGLDDVPSWRQERAQERREQILSGPAYEAALRFAAGFGGGLGLEP